MSVQGEINRLTGAKSAIAAAIAGKGVDVPDGTRLDGMASLIAGIDISIPIASAETLGGVKVGDGLSVDSNGLLSNAYSFTISNGILAITGP